MPQKHVLHIRERQRPLQHKCTHVHMTHSERARKATLDAAGPSDYVARPGDPSGRAFLPRMTMAWAPRPCAARRVLALTLPAK